MSLAVQPINSGYHQNDDNRTIALIQLVREGIRYRDFIGRVQDYPFNNKDWSVFLNTTTRTLDRYQGENKKFNPKQSERIIEIQMVMEFGKSVFGGTDRFFHWLDQSNLALGGQRPKELFDTTLGINMVKDLLGKMEHGIFA